MEKLVMVIKHAKRLGWAATLGCGPLTRSRRPRTRVLASGAKTEHTATRGLWGPLDPNLPSLLRESGRLAVIWTYAWKMFVKRVHGIQVGRGRGEGCLRALNWIPCTQP
jgi:hypothetical protein